MTAMTYLACILCHAWICVIGQIVITLHKQSASVNWKFGPIIASRMWRIRSGYYCVVNTYTVKNILSFIKL